ncbi:MAG: UDP-N-acetylmuramoyl-L-alanyl-D-glutamate--2,6-diaminopimelate ligase [Acidobacteria bacterium]|nr:UDP-N-acetylmuramoyl-L-alanyl-D-glutamate--2,6-diaminopimelate ligase [Acidobacteriota bacterium]
MLLRDVLEHLEVISITGNLDANVRGIACDSRKVGRDFLFAAVRGEKFDGHEFIPSAQEGGANTVISEQPPSVSFRNLNWVQVTNIRQAMGVLALELYRRPDLRVPYIGITGTNGKTTLTYLLEAILTKGGGSPAVMGTISYRHAGRDVPAQRTTPEAPDLAAFADDVIAAGATHLVMEVSAHALTLQRVYGAAFDTVILTNFTQDHLDYYGSLDHYWDAKCRLFDGRNGPLPQRIIVNVDDDHGAALFDDFPGEKHSTGRRAGASFRIGEPAFDTAGLRFTLHHEGTAYRLAAPLTGMGNVHNVAQAFVCGLLYGIPAGAVLEALAEVAPIPGRMEEVNSGQDFRVLVDYAHTEDALRNACQILRQITPGRLIVVFGCGGDRDRTKRPRMGRIVAELADMVIVTSDNPRSEDPEAIIDEIIPGIREIRDDYIRLTDRRAAIARAIGLAEAGDTVLLAGKGHETGQIIGPRILPFVDREVALAELRRRRESAS